MGAEKCQKRVLVVEDNELNRKIAAQVIEDEGILTECAIDGLEAVKKVREAPEHYFDLILMDVQMPVMNGYEATRAIRTMHRDGAKAVPILAMTADAFSEDIQAAKDAGMNGHMAKPLDKAILWREIGKYLNSDFSPETAGKSGVNH